MISLFYGNRRIYENREIRRLSGVLSGVKCSPGVQRCSYRQRRTEKETNGWKCRSTSLQEPSTLNSARSTIKRDRISMPVKLSTSSYFDQQYAVVCNGNLDIHADNGSMPMLNRKEENKNVHIDPDHKVYLHGYCGVGKSLLLERLVEHFTTEKEADIIEYSHDDHVTMSTTINSRRNILDFTELDVLNRRLSKGGDIHVVVYAINDTTSMKYAIDCVVNLRWKCRTQCPIIVVGNKVDIVRNRPDLRTDVKFMTEKLNCHYVEASAMLDYKIEDLSSTLTKYLNGECVELKEPKRKALFKAVLKQLKFWKK